MSIGSSSEQRSLPKEEVQERSLRGTWLSILDQPQPRSGRRDELPVPVDARQRNYIRSAAFSRDSVAAENERHRGAGPGEIFKIYPFLTIAPETRKTEPRILRRSVRNVPLSIPCEILPEMCVPTVRRDKRGMPDSGSLRYCWLEKGVLAVDGVNEEYCFTVQIRHHTRLEAHHDHVRPVYCINFKTDFEPFLDLRLVAIVTTEFPFLESAAAAFARAGDAFAGKPVVDRQGRVLLDERVIRRAAFTYGEHQRDALRGPVAGLSDEIRRAHFLVWRSHFPELRFRPEQGDFEFVQAAAQPLAEAA